MSSLFTGGGGVFSIASGRRAGPGRPHPDSARPGEVAGVASDRLGTPWGRLAAAAFA